MKANRWTIAALALLLAGAAACYHPYGSRRYADTPRLRPTDPGAVELLRREPRRDHLKIGEVWLRPDPGMSRRYVEGTLRTKAAAMGADALVIVQDRYFEDGVVYSWWRGPMRLYERQIVGVAIRYRR